MLPHTSLLYKPVDWAQAYTPSEIFQKGFFKSIQLRDDKISDRDIEARMQEYRDFEPSRILDHPTPTYPNQMLVYKPKVFPNGYVIQHTIHPDIKSELLTKAWIMGKTTEFNESIVPKHYPNDKDQKWQPDEQRLDKLFVEIEMPPVPDESAQWSSMNIEEYSTWNDNGGYYATAFDHPVRNNRMAYDEEKDYYAPFRKPFTKLGCYKIPERQSANTIQHLRETRSTAEEDRRKQLDEIYTDLVKDRFKSVLEEIDDLAWIPEQQSSVPVFAQGGHIFREWKQDSFDLLDQ